MFARVLIILLAVAAGGMLAVGIVSYWHGVPRDALWIDTNDDQWRVQAAVVDGTVHVVQVGGPQTWPARVGTTDFAAAYGPFSARRVSQNAAVATGVGMPFWALGIVLAGYPLAACVRGPVRRWRRRRRGLCVRCGYRLQGLPERRCPECGTTF